MQEQRVSALFSALISKISPELRKWRENGSNESVWVRNSALENMIDLRLTEFQSELLKLIVNNSTESWNLAADKNDILVSQYIKNLAISELVKNGFFDRNLHALESFQSRVDNGLTLSDRIFQTSQGAKQQFEFYLKSGIGTGRSADQISRDIRQLMTNPDKRFRRVRNESGELVPSKPMADYHPGQGVYRSAYKNALRVAVTETNMSYRLSDCERWKQLDFVLGFEVRRSRNAAPCAICDALVGRYPKDFIFPGWHPFCICIATPILMSHDQSANYFLSKYSKKFKGKQQPIQYVDKLPESALQFMSNNPKQVSNSYWGKYNDL